MPESDAPREILPGSRIHPSIARKVASYRGEEVATVKALAAAHRVLIVGMAQNVFPKRARRLLDARGIAYEYLSIGSYFSEWRRRLALKLWTGWTTFPMVFVDGVLIGGYEDLKSQVDSGELQRTLAGPRAV